MIPYARLHVTPALKSLLAALLIAASILACSPDAASPGADSSANAPIGSPAATASSEPTTLQVAMKPFVLAYMQAARQGNHRIEGSLQLPAVWLFGPDGRLVQQITSAQELQPLPEGLSSLPPPQEAAVPFSMIARVFEEQFDARLPKAPDDASWTALLLLSDQGCENTCPQFLGEVRRIVQMAPDQVHSVVVTLNR